ncbi:MAG: PhoH family protein, partial [Bacteroidota bacterium]
MKEIPIPNLHNPVDFFGVNDANLDLIRKKFPSLKIVSRGSELRIIGDETLISSAESLIMSMIETFEKRGRLEPTVVSDMLGGKIEKEASLFNSDTDIIVYGQHGLVVKARTPGQRRLVTSCNKNDITFAIGPAGTGKTYTAVALAVRALK